MPTSQVFNLDCLEYLKSVPDKFFELAIVDPQFGIGNFVQSKGNIRGEKVNWNDAPPTHFYFKELRRVSKHRIIFGANYFNQFEDNGGAIVWVKNQLMPDFSKAVIASCSFHKKIELYEQTWTNFVQKGRSGIHPCEMPIDIYRWLLENYAKKGDKILDTHMGSQSSRIAAYDMGFDYWGTELDVDYFEAGNKRFELFKSQGKLF